LADAAASGEPIMNPTMVTAKVASPAIAPNPRGAFRSRLLIFIPGPLRTFARADAPCVHGGQPTPQHNDCQALAEMTTARLARKDVAPLSATG
jgi:hypothetical protein